MLKGFFSRVVGIDPILEQHDHHIPADAYAAWLALTSELWMACGWRYGVVETADIVEALRAQADPAATEGE